MPCVKAPRVQSNNARMLQFGGRLRGDQRGVMVRFLRGLFRRTRTQFGKLFQVVGEL